MLSVSVVKAFPKDNKAAEPHLTGFLGYKAGMTHVARVVKIRGSKMSDQEVVEAATVIDTPPMVVVGVVGYVRTPQGLKTVTTAMAKSLSDTFRRRLYHKWAGSKKLAFTKYAKNATDADVDGKLKLIKEKADVVRVLAHTQMQLVQTPQKKAHVMEIQVNGGDVAAKVNFASALLEKEIGVADVFNKDEMIDTCSATNGKGYQGVIKRWGVKRLPRKTHRGLRKVACIGAWHPSRISFTVARSGQMGYHHRTLTNKKVFRVGSGADAGNGSTAADLTKKNISPIGGFPHYGYVKNDFLLLKGTTAGCVRRPVTLRKSLLQQVSRLAEEEVELTFIDTSSKFGHGRFQTKEEKKEFFGRLKHHTTTA